MDSTPWFSKPEWWAIIFATLMSLAAITQSYWAAPVKAIFLPKRISIYNALLPDISFGVAGSCIGLCGSLISKNASTLVTGLRVRVRRMSDGGEYTLDALFNRKRLVTMAGDSIDADIWTIMQLPQDEPKSYDVTFCNDGARAAIKTCCDATRAAWFQRVAQQVAAPLVGGGQDNINRVAQAIQAMFNDPLNTQFIADGISRVLDHFFWREGAYTVALVVQGEATRHVFERRWQITITPEMESQLRSNARRLVATWCLQPPAVVGQFFTAWPQYEDPA